MRSCRAAAAVAAAVAATVAGCGPDTDRATIRAETVVDTTAGIVHVANSGTAPAWVAEPVVRLGAMDGGPEEFGRIRSVIADARGNIYVADNIAGEVRVFSPEGGHLRTFGRAGGGPGEFGDLYGLAWVGGNLAAMDPRNARIGILSPDGDWVDGIRHYPITGSASLVRLHPLGDDGFYAPIIDPGRPGLPFVRTTAAGAADTIPAPQRPGGAASTGTLCHRPDGGITGISVLEAPGLVYAFPPPGGEMAVSWTETYRIAVTTAAGDTLRVMTREQPPIPYPDELWDEAMRPYDELREQWPGAQCEPAAPARPRYRSALRHIMFDERGRMWVEAADGAGFAWDVFEPDGRLIGSAPAPRRAAGIPPYVRNGFLYQVETDELDVQHVAVYRVGPPPSS